MLLRVLLIFFSFHASGLHKANLTGGLTRIQELLNVTKKPHTPSLTIYFDSKYNIKCLATIRSLCYAEILFQKIKDVVVSWTIEYQPTQLGSFYPLHSLFISDSWKQCQWRIRLKLDVFKLWKCQKRIQYIVGVIQASIECNNRLSFVWSSDHEGILDIWIHEQCIGNVADILAKSKDKASITAHHIETIQTYITTERKVEMFCKKMIFYILSLPFSGVQEVADAYFVKSTTTQEWYVETNGGNLKDLLSKPQVDTKRSCSNNVWDMLNLFGIDCAREFLKVEFLKEIKINARHLELLINVMTYSGKLRSVSRHGIDRREVGPLSKASFEQPVDNFLISATFGELDSIASVSAAVTVGKLAPMGTNIFDIKTYQSMEELKEQMRINKQNKQKAQRQQVLLSSVIEHADEDEPEPEVEQDIEETEDAEEEDTLDLLETEQYNPDDDEDSSKADIMEKDVEDEPANGSDEGEDDDYDGNMYDDEDD